MKRPNMSEYYAKIAMVIRSCETKEQLAVAKDMYINFCKTYSNSAYTMADRYADELDSMLTNKDKELFPNEPS